MAYILPQCVLHRCYLLLSMLPAADLVPFVLQQPSALLFQIQKYENLSWETCVKCGKPATHLSIGWICPYCEDCVNKSEHPERFVKRGTEEEKTLILY